MKPNISVLPIDSRLLASILSNEAVFEAADRLARLLAEARDTDELWEKLFAGISEIIPAERGAVLLARAKESGLEPVVFRGTPVDLSRQLATRSLQESSAIFTATTICVPMQAGAIHVESSTARPFTLDHVHRLIAVVRETAKAIPLLRRIESLEGEKSDFQEFNYVNHGIIGDSAPMREVHKLIYKVAPRESTVLIGGETGTGKDLVARAIHRNSPRAKGPFMAINCAAVNENLIETELFGYERGAFTGANSSKKGKVEVASGGTLFLDEIAETSPNVQTKFFRLLENHEFQRVGGTETLHADVRVIAATNLDLKQLVQDGKFREELYYRLNVIKFTMPSLRERRDDIPPLARHFLKKFSTRTHPVHDLAAATLAILADYDWPGNVRELQNVIESSVGMADSEIIQPENLPADIREIASAHFPRTGLDAAVAAFKKSYIERARDEARGDLVAMAEQLEISLSYAYRLAKRLGIDLA